MKVRVRLAVDEYTGEIITEQIFLSIIAERKRLRTRFKEEAEKFFYNSATYTSDFLTNQGMSYLNDDLTELVSYRAREIFEDSITKEELLENFLDIIMERFDEYPTDYIGDIFPNLGDYEFETYIIEIAEEDIVG